MEITKIDMTYEEMQVKEMNNLEINGATYILYKAICKSEEETYGEVYTHISGLENELYYCGKHFNFNDCWWIQGYYISSVFMLKNSFENLFAIASDSMDFEKDYIVRIDY